jgi:hypothetical protein
MPILNSNPIIYLGAHGRMQDFSQGGQISDCNSLSGLNPLTNRVLNKIIII